MVVSLGISAQWNDASSRFIGSDLNVLIAYDAVSNQKLWAELLDGHWICVGPTGHCRGSKGVAEHVVYVAQLDDGSNITLSPQEFAKRFGWKNDPEKATLLGLDE
jgi:hypothetical protein